MDIDTVFPVFSALPMLKELPESFFQFRFDGFPSPKRHWAFCGEIVEDCLTKKEDHKTVVRCRSAVSVPVIFLFEKDAPCTFKWKELKKAHTMFVMYAEQDPVTKGIRVEALDYVAVVCKPLDVVLDLLKQGKNFDDEKLELVVKNVNCEWKDEYKPFPIVGKMPVMSDFFGKGTVE